ncbi:MAG: DoxX family protein [Beijerinckiaceae bacterium]|nr:DoxX family protein [Beijerinckiaceae bacterium]
MSNITILPASLAPHLHAALRIMTGLLFLAHGTSKLLGFPHDPNFDRLTLFSFMGLAGALELVGGALIVVGLFTRPVAFVLAGMMAVAYFMAHGSKGFFPSLNGGDAAILFCFVFLYLAAAGPGPWSLDRDRA